MPSNTWGHRPVFPTLFYLKSRYINILASCPRMVLNVFQPKQKLSLDSNVIVRYPTLKYSGAVGGIMSRLVKVILVVLLSLYLFSCDRRDPFKPNLPEAARLSFTEDKITLDTGEFTYRQTIIVEEKKVEGLLFAYKLSTLKAEELPGFSYDAEGWLIFAGQSIWTPNNQLSVEFTSHEGKIDDLISKVQVKIKHPDGEIEEFESPFKSSRLFGSWIEAPSNGVEVSAGLEILMHESIGDIYVDGMYAHHFMYRLNIINEAMELIQPGIWYNSINNPDIRKAILNLNTTPALIHNDPGTYTQFECYVVSRTGLIQAEPVSVYFRVVGGNQPVALIYPQTIAGLGQYHYALYDESYLYTYSLIPTNGVRQNRELWVTDNNLEAINSPDFRLHLRWGYRGQYGIISSSGATICTDNPFHGEVSYVLNPEGYHYGSRITAFWLRLDGVPFPVQSQFFASQVVSSANGDAWLRVVNFNDNCRHCILPGLSNGQHVVELKVEDLQGVLSETVQKNFTLVPYKSPQQRNGILIIDDDPDHPSYSPEDEVDAFYTAVTPTAWGPVAQIDLPHTGYPAMISPVQMQNYKAVLMHSDNPIHAGHLYYQVDALDVYLGNQGNLLLSGTHSIASQLQDLGQINHDFLTTRLGISNPEETSYLSPSLNQRTFFINAIGQQGLNDIPLNLNTSFNPLVQARQGLSAVTLFNPSLNLEWLYAFGCKPVDHPIYPPTQEQYDLYTSKYVAYKYQNSGSNVVIFGFPLSYMEQAPVATALNQIFNDILGNKVAQRRNK